MDLGRKDFNVMNGKDNFGEKDSNLKMERKEGTEEGGNDGI